MISDQNPSTYSTLSSIEVEDEVDFLTIAKTLWSSRKILIISLIVGAFLGLFFAIITPKEYTVSTIMVPQMSNSSKSQLGGLAALAGLDLGMAQSSELSPIIYPKIVNSVPFKLELMNAPINFEGIDKPVSIYDFYTKYKKPSILGIISKYTVGLPRVIINGLKKKPKELTLPKHIYNQPIHLTKKQYAIKKALDEMISLQVEKKEGYLTLIVKMPEALAAAQLAKIAQELLQRDITKFKVEKSQADLDFIQGRYDIAKAEAEKYQVNIAANTDRFKNLTSILPQVGTARIQTKYAIANNVFQDLAKQLEQAKIQVKKDTPVFAIVEPVVIPTENSKPSRFKIFVIWIFLSGVIGVGIVYGKKVMFGIKKRWNDISIEK